jgi:hypothetical protein
MDAVFSSNELTNIQNQTKETEDSTAIVEIE